MDPYQGMLPDDARSDILQGRTSFATVAAPPAQEQTRPLHVTHSPHGTARFIPPLVHQHLLNYVNSGGNLSTFHDACNSLMKLGANNDERTAMLRNGCLSLSRKTSYLTPYFQIELSNLKKAQGACRHPPTIPAGIRPPFQFHTTSPPVPGL